MNNTRSISLFAMYGLAACVIGFALASTGVAVSSFAGIVGFCLTMMVYVAHTMNREATLHVLRGVGIFLLYFIVTLVITAIVTYLAGPFAGVAMILAGLIFYMFRVFG